MVDAIQGQGQEQKVVVTEKYDKVKTVALVVLAVFFVIQLFVVNQNNQLVVWSVFFVLVAVFVYDQYFGRRYRPVNVYEMAPHIAGQLEHRFGVQGVDSHDFQAYPLGDYTLISFAQPQDLVIMVTAKGDIVGRLRMTLKQVINMANVNELMRTPIMDEFRRSLLHKKLGDGVAGMNLPEGGGEE